MTEANNPWVSLMLRTFSDTRGAAKVLTQLRFNRDVLWMALALVSVLTVLSLEVYLMLTPLAGSDAAFVITPYVLTIVVGASLSVMVFALYFAGHALGGEARFPGALLLTIWWQALAIVLQWAQIVSTLISPLLAGFIGLGGLVFSIYCLVVFVDEMHGFHNIGKAIGTVIIAFVGIIFGLAFILTLIGVAAQGGAA